jgi:hypothetical protein
MDLGIRQIQHKGLVCFNINSHFVDLVRVGRSIVVRMGYQTL